MNYLVYIAPNSEDPKNEYPTPIPFRSRIKAENYAKACEEKGQKTRVVKEDK